MLGEASLEGRVRAWLTTLPMQDVGGTFETVPIFMRYTVRKFTGRLAKRWNLHALYLHEFFRSDKSRCPHSHPWWFITCVLKGGYWEHTDTGKHWRRPGYIRWYPANHFHRIEVE